jgi:hypothetical protein
VSNQFSNRVVGTRGGDLVETATGVFQLTAAEYRSRPGVSNSMLNAMDPPARLAAYVEDEPTASMVMGTLIHEAILEPGKPPTPIAVPPDKYVNDKGESKDWTFGANVCKSWRTEMESAGKIVVTRADWAKVQGCVQAILNHRVAREYFTKGHAELSVFHDRNGTLTKARPDFAPDSIPFLLDIKKVSRGNGDPRRFATHAVKMGYHRQAWSYLSAWNEETDEFRQGVIFVTVEEEPPHLVSLVQLSERTMELGREDYLRRLALYEECKATGFWSGYPESPVVAEPDEWVFRSCERDLA